MHSIRHMEVCSESSGCEQQREEIKVLCELYRDEDVLSESRKMELKG